MTHRVVLFCGIAALLSVVTLSAQPQQVDADTKEVLSYQLSLENMKQFVTATRNMLAAAKSDPRYIAVSKLEAEIKALEAKEEMTEADQERLEKLQADLDAAEAKMPNAGLNAQNTKSLADMEAAINKEPLMVAALKSAGMSARDYAKFTLAFFQAAMVHGMQKSGLVKEIPKDLQATVNMENIKFIEANQAQINALMAEFQAASKK